MATKKKPAKKKPGAKPERKIPVRPEGKFFEQAAPQAKLEGERLQLLLLAFSMGLNNEEACLFAGISERCLYNRFKDVPDFKEHCERLKRKPVIDAKITLAKDVQVDGKRALELLERLERGTYGKVDQLEVSGALNIKEMSDAELDSAIAEYLARVGVTPPSGS